MTTTRTIHRITSGEEPTVGLRVLTNEFRWGTITELGRMTNFDGTPNACGFYCESWHTVTYDDGRTVLQNCDRLSTREPSGIYA